MLTTIHFIICGLLILIVLLQQGKGADMGAAFGGGSNTVFGAAGADSLLTKITAVLAVLFMVSSVVLSIGGVNARQSVQQGAQTGEIFQELPTAADRPSAPPAAAETQKPAAESPPVAGQVVSPQPPVEKPEAAAPPVSVGP